MKKAFRHLLATLLALAMVCALAAPVFAANANMSNFRYSYYRIFKGDVIDKSGSNIISNVQWATGIDGATLLAALKADGTIGSKFQTCTDAKDVVNVIKNENWSDSDDKMIALARFFEAKRSSLEFISDASAGNGTVQFTEGGYYLITHDRGPYIATAGNFPVLYLARAGENITITPKNVYPTVKMQIEDLHQDGTSTFSDTYADLPINQSFKVKMTATVPKDEAYKYYACDYPITLTCEMPLSTDFEHFDSVKITSNSFSKTLTSGEYTESSDTSNSYEMRYSITINDFKTYTSTVFGTEDITIEVVLSAHLNTNCSAYYQTYSGPSSAWMYASLKYPADPTELGTPTTFVSTDKNNVSVDAYTYGIKVNKVTDQNAPLPNAKFRLYTDADCNYELKLAADTKNAANYYPVTTGEGVAMVSPADGKFSISGLDEGTYYLKEVETPAGYNTAEVATLTFNAEQTNGGSTITLTPSGELQTDPTSKDMTVTIVNKSGVVLPSTGGMGTTIFYVVGGLLMVGAAVLLVTKKRMQKN